MKLPLPNVIVYKLTRRTWRFLERVCIERIRSRRYCADEIPYPFARR